MLRRRVQRGPAPPATSGKCGRQAASTPYGQRGTDDQSLQLLSMVIRAGKPQGPSVALRGTSAVYRIGTATTGTTQVVKPLWRTSYSEQ